MSELGRSELDHRIPIDQRGCYVDSHAYWPCATTDIAEDLADAFGKGVLRGNSGLRVSSASSRGTKLHSRDAGIESNRVQNYASWE